jgi:hypothetical protein
MRLLLSLMRALVLLSVHRAATVHAGPFMPRPAAAWKAPTLRTVSSVVSNGGAKNTAQVMITNRMKNTLINDLKYTEIEVERMEPEIARVVIEKGLKRPMSGMPISWDRSFRGHLGFMDRVRSVSEFSVDTIRVVAEALTNEKIVYMGYTAGSLYVLRKLFNAIIYPNRPDMKLYNKVASPRKESQLDLKYLEYLQRFTFLDKVRIAIDVIKNRIL